MQCFVYILVRPNKKISCLASFFSDFDGWVGGFYLFIFLNFLFVQIKGRGWVSAHCFISHALTSIKLLFLSIYSISYEVYSSFDMKNTFSCCNINNFLADSLFPVFRKKSVQWNKSINYKSLSQYLHVYPT